MRDVCTIEDWVQVPPAPLLFFIAKRILKFIRNLTAKYYANSKEKGRQRRIPVYVGLSERLGVGLQNQ